ncbi:MAG: hypothetical protein ACE5IO_08155 [Thermoplasmata archaeon]
MRFIGDFFRDLRTPLYRNAIFLMANTAVACGIGLFFWMVVARLYTPYEVALPYRQYQSRNQLELHF